MKDNKNKQHDKELKTKSKQVRRVEKKYIFAVQIWSGGRVARQRFAKPCTAVRIRSRPQPVESHCFRMMGLF